MHEVGDLVGSGEALVGELEVVVEESLVAFEVIGLASEELVDLGEVGAVHGFSNLRRKEGERGGGLTGWGPWLTWCSSERSLSE